MTAPRVLSRRRGNENPPKGSVYVGRPTRWGNPFVVGANYTQEEAVEAYRAWLMAPERAWLRAEMRESLRGKNLVCWCHPKVCHADVILEVANA